MPSSQRPKKRSGWSILWLLTPLIFSPTRYAHAYLDPNTGSYAIQIIIGVVFGAAYSLRMFSRRIVSWFSKKPKATSDTEVETDA